MNRPRLLVGGLGLVLVVGALAFAGTGLPAFGHYDHALGALLARDTVPQRSATNAVVVTTFDYRAFDTLGEEFILFIAVIGVVVLLRGLREEEDGDAGAPVDLAARRSSESLRWLGRILVGPMLVLGAYVVTHGHLTPGGGFQGGLILAAGIALLYLGGRFAFLLRLRGGATTLEVLDGAGAAGFALIGFGGLFGAGAFFANWLPSGSSGLLTGGVIPLANISVGIEVTGAILMVLSELFDRRLLPGRE